MSKVCSSRMSSLVIATREQLVAPINLCDQGRRQTFRSQNNINHFQRVAPPNKNLLSFLVSFLIFFSAINTSRVIYLFICVVWKIDFRSLADEMSPSSWKLLKFFHISLSAGGQENVRAVKITAIKCMVQEIISFAFHDRLKLYEFVRNTRQQFRNFNCSRHLRNKFRMITKGTCVGLIYRTDNSKKFYKQLNNIYIVFSKVLTVYSKQK